MQSAYPDSLKGHLLMAMPGLSDPNFFQTVTCICEHNAYGAMGIVVNQPAADISFSDLLVQLDVIPAAVARAKLVIAEVNPRMPRWHIETLHDPATGQDVDTGCAMNLSDFDLVELNEVHRVVLESDDQGAVDMFGNPTYRGNIYRYNYWHHLGNWDGTGDTSHSQRAGIRLVGQFAHRV